MIDMSGNCVDVSKLIIALSYNLLDIKLSLASVSYKVFNDHAVVYYNNKLYSNGIKDYAIVKVVSFDNIPYAIF